MSDIVIDEASSDDMEAVIRVQREAFGRVAERLGIDPVNLPPLRESAEQLRDLMLSGTRFFVARSGGEVVGSVRGALIGDTVDVGRLVVDGRHLRRGVATGLMDALESAFPSASCYRLFTGRDAAEPLALYRGRGYVESLVDSSGPVELVWLEKRATVAPSDPLP